MSDSIKHNLSWEEFFGGPKRDTPIPDSPEMIKAKIETEQFFLQFAINEKDNELLALEAIKRLKKHPELIKEATDIWADGDPNRLSIPLMEAIRLYEEADPPECDKRCFESYLAKFEIRQQIKDDFCLP